MEHMPNELSEHRELTEYTPLTAATRKFMRLLQQVQWEEVDAKTPWTEEDFTAAECCFAEWPDEAQVFGEDCRITTEGLEKLAFDTRTPAHHAARLLDWLKARRLRRLRLRFLVSMGTSLYVPAASPSDL